MEKNLLNLEEGTKKVQDMARIPSLWRDGSALTYPFYNKVNTFVSSIIECLESVHFFNHNPN